jgi:hypothetical protein
MFSPSSPPSRKKAEKKMTFIFQDEVDEEDEKFNLSNS